MLLIGVFLAVFFLGLLSIEAPSLFSLFVSQSKIHYVHNFQTDRIIVKNTSGDHKFNPSIPANPTSVKLGMDFTIIDINGVPAIFRTNSQGKGIALIAAKKSRTTYTVKLFLGRDSLGVEKASELNKEFRFYRTYHLILEERELEHVEVQIDSVPVLNADFVSDFPPPFIDYVTFGDVWDANGTSAMILENVSLMTSDTDPTSLAHSRTHASKLISRGLFLLSALLFILLLILCVRFQKPVFDDNSSTLLSLTALTFVVMYALQWIAANYSAHPIVEQLSFRGVDPPWVPPGSLSTPLVGNHYFGDFLSYKAWVQWNNPHNASLVIPSAMIPLSDGFFIGLKYLAAIISGTPMAEFVLYTALTVFLIIYPIFRVLQEKKYPRKIFFIVFFVLLTWPFISTLDRGNCQGLVIGLILVSYWQYLEKKAMASAVLLGIAIGFKAYPALLLLYPFFRREWKYITVALLTALLPSTIVMLIIGNGLVSNVQGFWAGLTMNTGAGVFLSGVSLNGFVDRILYIFSPDSIFKSITPVLLKLTLVPGLAWLMILALVLWRNNIPPWIRGVLLVSSLQMSIPVAMMYTTSWTFVGVLLLLDSRDENLSYSHVLGWGKVNLMSMLAIFSLLFSMSSIISLFEIRSKFFFVHDLLSPLMLMMLLLAALYSSLTSKRMVFRKDTSTALPQIAG